MHWQDQRSKRMKAQRVFAILSLLVGIGCASEKSSHDQNREKENREIMRLRRAEGVYEGFASNHSQNLIPTRVTIKMLQNPGDDGDEPQLQVSLTIGLFGGVTLTATTTSFDWKTGELNASFPKKTMTGDSQASGSGIELQAIVKSDLHISDAVIKGSNSGDFQMSLKKSTGTVAEPDVIYRYYFTTANDTDAFLTAPKAEGLGVMSVKRLESTVTTSPTSDLPVLPGLETSFRFFGLADAPEIAKSVEYDPLKGVFEANLVSGASVIFTKVFASRNADEDDIFAIDPPRTWRGQVYFGSDPRMPFTLENVTTYGDLTPADMLPPKSFVGSYQGSNGGLVWNLIAHIDYLGGSGGNVVGETAFTTFPNLRMRMVTCMGNRPYNVKILNLSFVDHINSFVRFQVDSPSGLKILELNYLKHWQDLEGTYIERNQEGSDLPRTSTVTLKAMPEELTEGCAYFDGQ